MAPGGQTGTAKPRAAVPRRVQGRAGLLPLGEPDWAARILSGVRDAPYLPAAVSASWGRERLGNGGAELG